MLNQVVSLQVLDIMLLYELCKRGFSIGTKCPGTSINIGPFSFLAIFDCK